jgi:serine protease Do
MTARGGTLANATVSSRGTEAGYLAIDSNVTFGASGAPVLDGSGLVQGVIGRRIGFEHVLAVDAKQATPSCMPIMSPSRRTTGAGSRVRACAASISARVTRLQN